MDINDPANPKERGYFIPKPGDGPMRRSPTTSIRTIVGCCSLPTRNAASTSSSSRDEVEWLILLRSFPRQREPRASNFSRLGPRFRGDERRGIAASRLPFCSRRSARPAVAQETFYNGKTVTLVVGYSAGGGYDQYARMLARHLGRHIPGNPNVIVQNMPGAASMTSVRYLDATAPKDGTVITTFDPGLITQVAAAARRVQGQVSPTYQWIGTLLRDIRICYAWARDRHQDLGRHDEAQGVPDRHHRQGLQRLCERRDPAQGVQRAGAADRRLSRAATSSASRSNAASSKAIAAPGPRCRRNGWSTEDQCAGAVLAEAARRHAGERCPTCTSLRKRRSRRTCSTSSMRPASSGGRSSSPSRCRRIGWRSCARRFRRRSRTRHSWPRRKKQNLLLDPVTGEEAEKIIAADLCGLAGAVRKVKDVLE